LKQINTEQKLNRTRWGAVVDASNLIGHIWSCHSPDLWPSDLILPKVAEATIMDANKGKQIHFLEMSSVTLTFESMTLKT